MNPPVPSEDYNEVDKINMACYSLYCQNERLRTHNTVITEQIKNEYKWLSHHVANPYNQLIKESRKIAEKVDISNLSISS